MLTEGDSAEDVGSEPLLSTLLLERLLPVRRGELEDPRARPRRQEAEQVAEVCLRLDPVELAAREERDEEGVRAGALVTAEEDPVLPAMRCSA